MMAADRRFLHVLMHAHLGDPELGQSGAGSCRIRRPDSEGIPVDLAISIHRRLLSLRPRRAITPPRPQHHSTHQPKPPTGVHSGCPWFCRSWECCPFVTEYEPPP